LQTERLPCWQSSLHCLCCLPRLYYIASNKILLGWGIVMCYIAHHTLRLCRHIKCLQTCYCRLHSCYILVSFTNPTSHAVSMSHYYICAPIPLPTISTSLFQKSSFGAADVPIDKWLDTSLKPERTDAGLRRATSMEEHFERAGWRLFLREH
jgi:hypothetical protein